MLDMVVATMVAFFSKPRAWQIAGGEEKDGVSVDHVAVAVGEEGAVGVAVKGDAEIGLLGATTSRATTAGWRAPQCSLMLRPSGLAWVKRTSPPARALSSAKSCRRDGGGGSVGAVDDDALAREREVGNGFEQEADVLGAVGVVDCGWGLMGAGRGAVGVGGGVELAKDLCLDGEFGGVGKLEAVGAEELDSIVLPGIVRGGDDHAGAESLKRVRKAMAGVVMTPALSTEAPPERRPAVRGGP